MNLNPPLPFPFQAQPLSYLRHFFSRLGSLRLCYPILYDSWQDTEAHPQQC